MLNKYLQPQRYVRRLKALAASLARPITDYEAEALTELVYQKTLAFNRATALDLGMGSERLLLAVGMASGERAGRAVPRARLRRRLRRCITSSPPCCSTTSPFRWAVVETPSMVRKARSLETESLKFFEDIASANAWLGSVDLVNSNSVLQYLKDPLQTTRQLLELSPKVVLWERLMLSNGATHADQQRTMLFDHGPGAVSARVSGTARLAMTSSACRAPISFPRMRARYRLRAARKTSGIFDLSVFATA